MREFIAVVDDDPVITNLVSFALEQEGFQVKEFQDAQTFYDFLPQDTPDLIILDLLLPDTDGTQICKYLRSQAEYREIPIIMLTGRGSETDRVFGLNIGADDYVTKPFSLPELIARVRAVLRRSHEKPERQTIRIHEKFAINLLKYQVLINNENVKLTATEFNLLKILATNPGLVFSRQQLLDKAWGDEKFVYDRTVDVHIKNLRTKLGPFKDCIQTIVGIGYSFNNKPKVEL